MANIPKAIIFDWSKLSGDCFLDVNKSSLFFPTFSQFRPFMIRSQNSFFSFQIFNIHFQILKLWRPQVFDF